jgi:hypothetical protein
MLIVLRALRLGYEEKDEWIFEDFVKERLKSFGILK